MVDIIVIDNDEAEIKHLKTYLGKKNFKLKIWEYFNVFLRIKVAKSKKGIVISNRQ